MVAGHGASPRAAWATRGRWVAIIHKPARNTVAPQTNSVGPGRSERRATYSPTSETRATRMAGMTWSATSLAGSVLRWGPLYLGSEAHRATPSPTSGSQASGGAGAAAGGAAFLAVDDLPRWAI